jgi:hypothetical protein
MRTGGGLSLFHHTLFSARRSQQGHHIKMGKRDHDNHRCEWKTESWVPNRTGCFLWVLSITLLFSFPFPCTRSAAPNAEAIVAPASLFTNRREEVFSETELPLLPGSRKPSSQIPCGYPRVLLRINSEY